MDPDHIYKLELLYRGQPKLINVRSLEKQSGRDTLFDQVIHLEMTARSRNEALFFRGTNGVGTTQGLLLEYPLKGESDLSLSFGASLYAGLFADSYPLNENNQSAVAMGYIHQSKFGYALSIDKNDYYKGGFARGIFEAPPLGLIGRLMSAGEYFHPRTKVGGKGVDDHAEPLGIILARPLSFYRKTDFMINTEKTPVQMAREVASYIADHGVLLTLRGSMPEGTSGKDVLAFQKKMLAHIPVTDEKELLNLVSLLSSSDEEIRSGAETELKWARPQQKAVLDAIIALLDDYRNTIREAPLVLLAEFCPGDRQREVLEKIVSRAEGFTKDSRVKSRAAALIKKLTSFYDFLADRFQKEHDPKVKSSLALLLREIPSEYSSVRRALLQGIHDQDQGVAKSACDALTWAKFDKEDILHLFSLLEKKEPDPRKCAGNLLDREPYRGKVDSAYVSKWLKYLRNPKVSVGEKFEKKTLDAILESYVSTLKK